MDGHSILDRGISYVAVFACCGRVCGVLGRNDFDGGHIIPWHSRPRRSSPVAILGVGDAYVEFFA